MGSADASSVAGIAVVEPSSWLDHLDQGLHTDTNQAATCKVAEPCSTAAIVATGCLMVDSVCTASKQGRVVVGTWSIEVEARTYTEVDLDIIAASLSKVVGTCLVDTFQGQNQLVAEQKDSI